MRLNQDEQEEIVTRELIFKIILIHLFHQQQEQSNYAQHVSMSANNNRDQLRCRCKLFPSTRS